MEPRILLVDDDALNREILETFLTMFQFQVLIANDGASAIRVAQETLPDLIITDIRMPDMTGFELIVELRNNPLFAQTPIMIVSGFNEQSDMDEGKRVGANDYVARPIDLKDFLSRVKALVNPQTNSD